MEKSAVHSKDPEWVGQTPLKSSLYTRHLAYFEYLQAAVYLIFTN